MGKLENSFREKRKKENIRKIILSSIYGAGLLSVALLAPNAVSVIGKFFGKKLARKNYIVKRSITGLVDAGFIRIENTSQGKFFRLTPKGERKLKSFYDGAARIKKPKRWDGKWRVVIYDFNERRKSLRNRVRALLVHFGFMRLQDSVWVYPYDCEDLINLIKVDFRIGKDVLYMIVDSLENDRWLRKSFSLS